MNKSVNIITKENISNEEFIRMMILTHELDVFFNKKTEVLDLITFLYKDVTPLLLVEENKKRG